MRGEIGVPVVHLRHGVGCGMCVPRLRRRAEGSISREPLCNPCAPLPRVLCPLPARSMPCTCGSRRVSTRDLWRLSSLSSLSTELQFPRGRSPLSLSLWHTWMHVQAWAVSLSLSLSHSLPNAYASFSSRRHSRFRSNPALCHTTARYLALRESPNVGQNRTARLHPGMNGCFGCSGSPPPHCLCQSSARTQGGLL